MASSNFKKDKKKSIITETLEHKKTLQNTHKENFKISFEFLDTTQKYGSSFRDLQKCGLLSKMLEVLEGYCKRALIEQVDGTKFTIYGDFPPEDKTYFKYPKNVPEDAKWARIHITGAFVIAGHFLSNTFYVVFLDKTHKFWLTKKITGK